MIHAINHNKIKYEKEKRNEDSLTSSIFGTLLYLPIDQFCTLLNESLNSSKFLMNTGKLLNYEFWPHWDATNTKNNNFIEPDVFLQFENLDLIIEAKRRDNNSQKEGQWKDQIKAYNNEFQNHSQDVLLLAIGGNDSTESKTIEGITIYRVHWSTLLSTIKKNIYLLLLLINTYLKA